MESKYDVIIGLEIHIQTKTKSGMFCSCSGDYFQKTPNTNTCPVCLGLPGALPIPNRVAIEKCIQLGLATNCTINSILRFDRKHYFYPDLPKGYQISQYDDPLCRNGYLDIYNEKGEATRIEIERIHQEEDVAKSIHEKDKDGNEYTLIDYNKSGVPLIEIVTKPVIRSSKEAKAFATKIRQTVRWLGISDADMEKGQMRCEPNISVQLKGNWKYEDGKILPINGGILNPKVEVKNIGSITAIEKSIDFEVRRMIEEIEEGKTLTQQTRGWNAITGTTEFQRSKENAADYRYFPEPDIPLIEIEDDDVKRIKSLNITTPDTQYIKYLKEYGLSPYDCTVLSSDRNVSEYFDRVISYLSNKLDIKESAKEAANWITGILFSISNEKGLSLNELNVDVREFSDLIIKVKDGKILISKAKEILVQSINDGVSLNLLLTQTGEIINDETLIEELVAHVIENNPKPVTDYKSGKTTVIMFLVGQVMKESKGSINPSKAKEILEKLLNK